MELDSKVGAEIIAQGFPRSRWIAWVQLAILIGVIGYLYADILERLAEQWSNDPNFQHGFFVPPFSALVVWLERKRLRQIPLRPAWSGLVVIAGALAVMIVGVLGAELFLSRSSLVLLLGGLVIYRAGWGIFRAVLFPWACLFLMIPIPAIVFNQIAFPLQLFASQLAAELLGLFSVPVLREGNVVHLPTMVLEVVEACSGIRSLVTLGTLAIMYGYFLEPRVFRRILLALASVPIAVAANALRVMGTGLLGHWWNPEKAEGFFHTFSGLVMFAVSLVMLFAVHWFMNLIGRGQNPQVIPDSRRAS